MLVCRVILCWSACPYGAPLFYQLPLVDTSTLDHLLHALYHPCVGGGGLCETILKVLCMIQVKPHDAAIYGLGLPRETPPQRVCAVPCCAMLCGVVWCDMMGCGVVCCCMLCCVVLYGAMWCDVSGVPHGVLCSVCCVLCAGVVLSCGQLACVVCVCHVALAHGMWLEGTGRCK